MGIARDTWRAVLVLVVGVLLLEAAGLRRQEPAPAPPTVTTNWQPAPPYMPTPVVIQQQQPERPLRRVASAIMEFGDSLIGVVR